MEDPQNIHQQISKIREIVGKGNLEKTISRLKPLCAKFKDLDESLLHLESRNSNLKCEKLKGTISFGDEQTTINKIREGLISLIGDLENRFPTKNDKDKSKNENYEHNSVKNLNLEQEEKAYSIPVEILISFLPERFKTFERDLRKSMKQSSISKSIRLRQNEWAIEGDLRHELIYLQEGIENLQQIKETFDELSLNSDKDIRQIRTWLKIMGDWTGFQTSKLKTYVPSEKLIIYLKHFKQLLNELEDEFEEAITAVASGEEAEIMSVESAMENVLIHMERLSSKGNIRYKKLKEFREAKIIDFIATQKTNKT